MRYYIEATDDGYRLGFESADRSFVSYYHERGGHGPIEGLYGQFEQLWHGELRKAGSPHREKGPRAQ